jgi:hypothetical protein
MNKFKKKLRSRVGASMILALVFMLFCTFVGSSVLASATANAQRVAQLAEQQDFMLQRSAALLMSDQLRLGNSQYLRLNVVDSVRTINEVDVGNGGVVTATGEKEEQRVISFTLTTNVPTLSQMQRLMVESTVWRYLRENTQGETRPLTVAVLNFPTATTADFLQQYTYPSAEADSRHIGGTMTVTVTPEAVNTTPATTMSIPGYTAAFSSGRDTELYDFFVSFGENSQVRMTMNGYSGSSTPITVEGTPVEGNLTNDDDPTGYIQISTVSTQTTISWQKPLVEKGGAQ